NKTVTFFVCEPFFHVIIINIISPVSNESLPFKKGSARARNRPHPAAKLREVYFSGLSSHTTSVAKAIIKTSVLKTDMGNTPSVIAYRMTLQSTGMHRPPLWITRLLHISIISLVYEV